jgi:hypothetical protein
VTKLSLGNWVSTPRNGRRIALRRRVHTSSGKSQAFCPIIMDDSFPESLPSGTANLRLRLRGAIPLLPMRFHSAVIYKIREITALLVPFLRPSKLKSPAYRAVVCGSSFTDFYSGGDNSKYRLRQGYSEILWFYLLPPGLEEPSRCSDFATDWTVRIPITARQFSCLRNLQTL